MHDYSKICRICMSNGSRDIFHRSNVDPNSPLERLLEKMRYVTMMKIEENDDLPRLICDLCIVQLNVAYNFKRQAVENDTKLRQYFIEHGITSRHLLASNEVNNVQNTANVTSNNNVNSNINIETSSVRSGFTNSNSTGLSPIVRRVTTSFPIMPIIVKTEPKDIMGDDLSHDTLSSNTVLMQRSNTMTSVPQENINNNAMEHLNNTSSMVYLNGYNINTLTPSSEVESYHNVSTNNTIIHRETIQLSSGSSTSSIQQSKVDVQNLPSVEKIISANEKSNSLNSADLARKRIAQKRLGGQLKTRRIMTESNNERKQKKSLEKFLQINMAPPAGKMSREEMKKKLFFGEKDNRKSISDETSTKESVKKRRNKILVNPFNNRKQESATRSRSGNYEREKVQKTIRNQSKELITSTIKTGPSKLTRKSTSENQKVQLKLIKPKIEPKN